MPSPIVQTVRDVVVDAERNHAREFAEAIHHGVDHHNAKVTLQHISDILSRTNTSVLNALPLMFTLDGKPYGLERHFFFEPVFSAHVASNTVYCCARQVGKCCCGQSKILMQDGSQITIRELVQNRYTGKVLAYDENGRFVPCKILNYWDTGNKACIEITTKTGRVCVSTPDHKYLTVNGWKPLKDINIGDRIAVLKKINYSSADSSTPRLLWDEVISLKDAGVRDTYDLEIEKHHNYIANNIVTHNSMSGIAAPSVAFGLLIKNMRILTVTPLYEQVRRLSQNYVRPFIEQSPIRSLIVDPRCSSSILQRDLLTGSTLFFSYAFTSVTRVRGIACDAIFYDELDDFDSEYPPIINQCNSSAPRNKRFIRRFGTPKTTDTLMSQCWIQSSQAEWTIRCPHCGHWNVPSLDQDLDVMIGPKTPAWKVCKETPGIICAGKSKVNGKRCGKPLDTRQAMWVHAYPDRRFSSVGYHIPQIVLPQHCEDSAAWSKLLDYREGADNMTPAKFYNEICGIPYDGSSRLITLTDLKKACILPTETTKIKDAAAYVKRKLNEGVYTNVVLSVDWGGGGAKELSFTTMAVACLRYDGKIDIPFGYRSLTPHDHEREIAAILSMRKMFNCSMIVHDGEGSGSAREAQLSMCGVPRNVFCRMFYHRLGRGSVCKWVPGDSRTGERAGYNLDKSRGLMWTVSLIKNGYINFFKYDTVDGGKLGLIDDFLSLIEDKMATRFASDVYTIMRASSSAQPDDFSACVCYAVHFFYAHVLRGRYPQINYLANTNITELNKDLVSLIEGEDFDFNL